MVAEICGTCKPSGMLPGFVSGFYTWDEVHIDLMKLAIFTGARLVHCEATGIDHKVNKFVSEQSWISLCASIHSPYRVIMLCCCCRKSWFCSRIDLQYHLMHYQ